jgi:hypothetical protein
VGAASAVDHGLHLPQEPRRGDLPVQGPALAKAGDGTLPSDFFRRNVVLSFQEDAIGIRLRDVIGIDNLMWGSDYPHSESTFPQSRKILAEILAGVHAHARVDSVRTVFHHPQGIFQLRTPGAP